MVRHCIYGVDINPMAVELCKVALWMETLDPGKPLSFLDHNIQCGNSLIGATPQLLEDGIPDDAFAPMTGDDKAYCSEFKKLNKKEREQQALFTRDLQPWERLGNLAAGMAQLDATDDDTLAGVQRQEAMYEELVRSSDYRYGRLLADAWCAAFVWQKTKAFAYPITEQVFRAHRAQPLQPAEVDGRGDRAAGRAVPVLPLAPGVPPGLHPAARGEDSRQRDSRLERRLRRGAAATRRGNASSCRSRSSSPHATRRSPPRPTRPHGSG